MIFHKEKKRMRPKHSFSIIAAMVIVPSVPIAALLLVFCSLFVRSMFRNCTLNHLIILLYIWQTEIAGVFAIWAATIGGAFIFYQTNAAAALEQTRRERRAVALRASLPMVLSELCDYAVSCSKKLLDLLSDPGTHVTLLGGIPIPPLPDDLLPSLIEIIETSPAEYIRPFADLIKSLQVQRASLRQTLADSSTGHLILRENLIHETIRAAEIYARCSQQFPYARGETANPSAVPSQDDLQSALFIICRSSRHWDEIRTEAERYKFIE